MEKQEVDRWLDSYISAWKSYDRAEIEGLFSDDVEYRYHPYDAPIRGREAVVRSWLGEDGSDQASSRDEPGTYEAAYRTIAIDGEIAVATGASRYFDEPGGSVTKVYDNCFVMKFDDSGRCREFTEWFMLRPGGAP